MAASLALLGFRKALSDASIAELIETYARAYVKTVRLFATSEVDRDFRLTLDNTHGPLRAVLEEARLQTRLSVLEMTTTLDGGDRKLAVVPGVRELEAAEKDAVLGAYREYLETIPEAKRQQSISYDVKDIVGRSGFGIGSAGLRAYNLLVEGRTQALENDVVLSMKQAQTPAVSRIVRDENVRSYFEHEGHRTAVSQGALQAHADPWVGWCSLDGVGQVIKELSPYEADLDWDAVTEMDEMVPLVHDLGRATAKVHCVSDEGNEHPLVDVNVEEKITAVIGDRDEAFVQSLAEWGAEYGRLTREDHRRFVDAFRNGMIRGVESD
jgi:uncharacterized protein (DUF2252 family)